MEETQNTKPKQIFILAGQSNMAGRGGVVRDSEPHRRHWDGIIPPECSPRENILRFNANLQWEPACEPLHFDIDTKKACGVGPGMPFANAVRDRLGLVGLVPCAIGGSAIKEWARGEELYENMVKRVRESLRDGGGEINALLWHQGESDCLSDEDASVYKVKMENFVDNVREDLGLPSLPIILVAIGSGDSRYIDKVREAQLGITKPNVVCLDAMGLPLQEDNLHHTTGAQVKMGLMLADAYIKHFAATECVSN